MLNNVILMGRLTADPELRTTEKGGLSVTRFSVAIDRRFQKQGEEKQTDFINCTAWRSTADFVTRYFKKGDMIALVGEIQTSNYTDKDGNKRTATEIVVNEVSFCGSKRDQNTAGNTTAASVKAANEATVAFGAADFTVLDDEDGLPF